MIIDNSVQFIKIGIKNLDEEISKYYGELVMALFGKKDERERDTEKGNK